MGDYFEEFKPDRTVEEEFIEEQQLSAEQKRLRILTDLLATDAGKRQLVEELRVHLPVGGGLFVPNSGIYKNTALADAVLAKLAELSRALTHEVESANSKTVHYCTEGIARVLLAWFFDIDISDL